MAGNTSFSEAGRYVLMRKDNPAVAFSWIPSEGAVLKGFDVIDRENMPFGCRDSKGDFSRLRLESWLSDRAIPALRPRVRKRLEEVGIASTGELLALGLGLSLSDQYWIKPAGADIVWADVNYFDNDFSPALGELLLSHDPDSIPPLVDMLKSTPSLLGSSPDAALNGNLPKRWEIAADGARILVKEGHARNRYQEPFNERLVSLLCARLLDDSEYVSYGLRSGGYLRYASTCPCMVDEDTEFVPAIQLHDSHMRDNQEDLGSFYIRICAQHVIDVAESVEKMLVIDYIVGNFDRHWNNFGVLVDSDSRAFKGAAPIFDTGASFWCDCELSAGFGGYRMRKQGAYRPFMRTLDEQMPRYCRRLLWFDADRLAGYCDEVTEVLSGNPLVANESGRIEAICAAVKARIGEVAAIAAAR